MLDVGARGLRDVEWQVAPGAGHHTVHQPAVEFEPARVTPAACHAGAGAGAPRSAQLALRIGVGKARVFHRHAQPRRGVRRTCAGRFDLPRELRAQLVERQQRVVEHTRQFEHAAFHADARFAARLSRTELQRGVAQAGPAHAPGFGRGLRREREATEQALGTVVQRRVERAVPLRAEFGEHAFGLEFGQQAPQRIAEWNARGHLRHLTQVEPLRAELAAACRFAFTLAPAQLHVALWPAHAVAGEETEALHVEHYIIVIALRDEAALDLLEGQRFDVLRQPQGHRAQGQVDGGGVRLAVFQLEPAAQRTHAFAQLERQCHVLAQLVHVDARQAGVGAAAPAPPVGAARQQRLREAGARGEAVAPRGRWGRFEVNVVLQQAVAHHQLYVAQYQRRGLALFVGPAQRAATDHELVLLEKPVGDGVAAFRTGAADLEPGHEDIALRIAPQFELGAVDQQLFEAQFERQQRARRNRRKHTRQAQRGAVLGVEHDHVAQFQRRHPAARAHLDLADAHRHTKCLARPRFDRLTPLLDVGQNRPVQCEPGDQQHADRRGQDHKNEARHPSQGRPTQRGRAGCSRASGRLGQRGWE